MSRLTLPDKPTLQSATMIGATVLAAAYLALGGSPDQLSGALGSAGAWGAKLAGAAGFLTMVFGARRAVGQVVDEQRRLRGINWINPDPHLQGVGQRRG